MNARNVTNPASRGTPVRHPSAPDVIVHDRRVASLAGFPGVVMAETGMVNPLWPEDEDCMGGYTDDDEDS